MKAVMYHYVRPNSSRPPYEYYYLDLDDFRRQLTVLAESYDLIDRETFLSYVRSGETPPDDAAILTFDDGLRDHHEWVLPELRERGLWGLFFVPGPLGDRLLPVHRVHSMLGTARAKDLARSLRSILREMDDVTDDMDDYGPVYTKNEFTASSRWFKRTLNYVVPDDRLPAVFDELHRRNPTLPDPDPAEYYMSREQIAELSSAGMLVGAHTRTHPVLTRLEPAEQAAELSASMAFVEDVADPPIRTFAYPYGGASVYDDRTLACLRRASCDVAFTTEPADVSPQDIENRPLRLPRWDCNEFPHGSASTS